MLQVEECPVETQKLDWVGWEAIQIIHCTIRLTRNLDATMVIVRAENLDKGIDKEYRVKMLRV